MSKEVEDTSDEYERFKRLYMDDPSVSSMSREDLVELLAYQGYHYERQIHQLTKANRTLNALADLATEKVVSERIKVAGKIPEAVLAGMQAGKKQIAQSGARQRHAPHHHAKLLVFEYLDESPPPKRGKDKKAFEIVDRKLVGETFRTVRKWIDEWEKLRSTGTP